MAHGYIETPTTHHIAPRATVEQVQPANEFIAAMMIGDALAGRPPMVRVTDFDGEFDVYRADEVRIGRRP